MPSEYSINSFDSIIEDLFTDEDYDYEDDLNPMNKPSIGSQFWTMKDGSKIKFRDMSLDHLNNVLNMLERQNEFISEAFRNYVENRNLDVNG